MAYYPKMNYWKNGTDCCGWDGITRDKMTGYVIGIDLSCSGLEGPIHPNSTLFSLRHLQKLNLAYNYFNPSTIPSKFGWFVKMTHLNVGDLGWDFTSKKGFSEVEMSHVYKPTKLRWNCGGIEIVVSEIEFLKMAKREKGAIGMDGTFKAIATEVDADHMTCHLITHEVNMSSISPASFKNLSVSLTSLHLYDCRLKGRFPDNIFHLPNLQLLDVRYNYNLTGSLPNYNWSRHFPWKNLEFLDLRSNLLQGPLPLPPLYTSFFSVSRNKLTGEIPSLICNLNSLEYLDLSYNHLSNMIPPCLGNLSDSLIDLNLRRSLPRSLVNCKKLEVLDLSNNKINGTFPRSLETLPELRVLVLRSNKFHGVIGIPKTKFPFPNLRIIDLSHNEFHGLLPTNFFKHLKAMTNANAYIGHMPPSLGNLTNIEWLDLSSNKLTGEIPMQLADLTSLAILNLSENSLVGPIPQGKQFNTFTNESFNGNLGLCGFPLTKTCGDDKGQQPQPTSTIQEDDFEFENGFHWKVVMLGYGCGFMFGLGMGYLVFSHERPKWLVNMVYGEQRNKVRRPKKNARGRVG
uniref:Leucine-rich repeat-containing N-terminal plant-type domain-containing protein n=1 Tax=Fagus sylvatica TaxID=28930 RepID=A0A2N9HB38_FAGSY